MKRLIEFHYSNAKLTTGLLGQVRWVPGKAGGNISLTLIFSSGTIHL